MTNLGILISWSDFFSEILPTISVTAEFWEYLDYYSFCDDGVLVGASVRPA